MADPKSLPGILGTKIGMTEIYDDAGTLHAVTVVKAGPCIVVQRKDGKNDGYTAVQIGLVEEKRQGKGVNKPMSGHFKKAGAPPMRIVREMRLAGDEARADLVAGAQLTVTEIQPGDKLDVIGTSVGKGFQGVMRRHKFSGGAATHGSMFHRAPGSIGASAFPSRVFKGTRMGGHMGASRVTVKNLPVLRVDGDRHLVYIVGAIPGPRNGVVLLRPSRSGKPGK